MRDVCCRTITCKLILGKTKALYKPSTLPFEKREGRITQEVRRSRGPSLNKKKYDDGDDDDDNNNNNEVLYTTSTFPPSS